MGEYRPVVKKYIGNKIATIDRFRTVVLSILSDINNRQAGSTFGFIEWTCACHFQEMFSSHSRVIIYYLFEPYM